MKQPVPDLLRPRLLHQWWWVALLPLAWFSLFRHLGVQPLQTWDESRLAVNAAEMLHNHNWLVTHYQGKADLWNTKPPLVVWLQAASLAVFGYSEWALRLPTAITALILTGLVVAFAQRWLGGPLAGLVAGLALLTSKGFVTNHVARTGDYDTLLLLFTTVQVLAAFAWLHTHRARYLLVLGAAVGLAVLTKSIAGLFFLPGIALVMVLRGQLLPLLRQPATWAAAALAIIPPALWYGVREYVAPGYWHAVWENDIAGRVLTSLEQPRAPWYDYLEIFVTQQFLLWTPWVLVAGWMLAQRPVPRPGPRFVQLVVWTGGLFFIVINTATTKHGWYAAPLYPLFALLVGGGLAQLARRVTTRRGVAAGKWRGVLLLALAVVPSLIALQRRLDKAIMEAYDNVELGYGRFLRDPQATPAPSTHFTAVHRGASAMTRTYNAPLEFYALAFRRTHPGQQLDVQYDVARLPAGQVVLACGKTPQARVMNRYHTRILYAADSCLTLQIIGPKYP